MLRKFYPDQYMTSTYQIDFQWYYDQGYRGVIFDIDNTLVPHGAPADVKAIQLFQHLRKIGLNSCVMSNNGLDRVQSFAEVVDCSYIYKANKPHPASYQKAMSIMGTNLQTTLMVGDQLFTDIWGAKRLQMRNVLVKPIHPKEEIQIVLKRRLEKIVLNSYAKQMNH